MPFHKILAAVDESPAGAQALRVGGQIATAAKAVLIALRVVDDPWPFIEPGEVETKRAMRDGSWTMVAANRVSDQLRQVVSSITPAVHTIPAVRFGIPAVEIARWAEQDHADLIVLGEEPRGPLASRRSTGTIDGTLRRARVPCLIVPFGQRTWRRVFVLADDGSAGGDVLERAFAFAEVLGSEVIVLEVERQLAFAEAGRTETVGRKAFGMWAQLPHAGTFDVMVRHGEAAAELLAVAREAQADLLVIGYRRGESADAPSIGARVVRGAPCGVLTVPV